jgi:hypothetical protein
MATDGKSAVMAAAEVPEDDLGEPDVKVGGLCASPASYDRS